MLIYKASTRNDFVVNDVLDSAAYQRMPDAWIVGVFEVSGLKFTAYSAFRGVVPNPYEYFAGSAALLRGTEADTVLCI